LIILSGALGHIKIQLEDVLELITRVQVAETFCDTGVLRGWSFHTHSRLGSLGASLDILILAGVIDDPVVDLFRPLRNFLVLTELLRRDHILNDHVLQLELVRQLINRIVHIVAFSIKVILNILQHACGFLVLLHELGELVVLEF